MSSSWDDEDEAIPPSARSRRGSLDFADNVSLASDHVARETNLDALQSPEYPPKQIGQAAHDLARASSDPPDPYRDNRWNGHPSTWRNLTAADRDIAISLQQLQARDLGIHLYNAHALKARISRLRGEIAGGSSPQDDPRAWKLPRLWAAWPMSAEHVPREANELWPNPREEGQTFRCINHHGGSRQSLEEIMIAVVTKEARERFLERECENEDCDSEKRTQPQNLSANNSRRSLRSLTTHLLEDSAQIPASNTSGTAIPVGTLGGIPEKEIEENTLKNEAYRSRSRSRRSRSSNAKNERVDTTDDELFFDHDSMSTGRRSLTPVPLANDEHATLIIQSSIRHILSRLDYLLTGLHQARCASLRLAYDSTSDSQTSGGQSRSISRMRRQGYSKSKASHPKVQRKRRSESESSLFCPDEPHSADESADSNSGRVRKYRRPTFTHRPSSQNDIPGARSRRRSSQPANIGQRDWSDIIGVAAMQGWPPEVIERTTARCSALFSEKMEFTTLELNSNSKIMKKDTAGESVDIPSDDEMEGGIHVDGFLRPIKRRQGWRGRNKEKGNWKSKNKENSKNATATKHTVGPKMGRGEVGKRKAKVRKPDMEKGSPSHRAKIPESEESGF